jgi:hypothetical protein
MENIFVNYEIAKQLMKYGFAEKCVALHIL